MFNLALGGGQKDGAGDVSVARMASKGMTEAWGNAFAAKPWDWRLMGVACGPREVDPGFHSSEEWCAWARGPNGKREEVRGSSPEDALLALTLRLQDLSG